MGQIVPVNQLDNLTPSKRQNLGDRLPTIQGGFINVFAYKNFNLAVNVLFNIGGSTIVDYRNDWNGRNLDNRNQSVNMLDRWQKIGDKANVPKLSRTTRFLPNSSRYVYENTYIKLSNLTLSYALPKKIADKLQGGRVSVFANATNLFYWYKAQSPANRNGLREYKFKFPEARSFTWGIKFGAN